MLSGYSTSYLRIDATMLHAVFHTCHIRHLRKLAMSMGDDVDGQEVQMEMANDTNDTDKTVVSDGGGEASCGESTSREALDAQPMCRTSRARVQVAC